MNELPDKIVNIDILRINRSIGKRCKCDQKSFVVDPANRSVYCGGCGALVDAWDALHYLATHYEELEEQVQALLEQRKEIASYKPHLVVFQELERRYAGKKMIPTCPHCRRGFYFEEIKGWIDRRFEEQKRWEEQFGEGVPGI